MITTTNTKDLHDTYLSFSLEKDYSFLWFKYTIVGHSYSFGSRTIAYGDNLFELKVWADLHNIKLKDIK